MHTFFILAIICTGLLNLEIVMFTYADYCRIYHDELMSGPLYLICCTVGTIARFVFGIGVLLLLCKNEETF